MRNFWRVSVSLNSTLWAKVLMGRTLEGEIEKLFTVGKLFFIHLLLQLKWSKLPSCFLPESHRGTEISDIDGAGLDFCMSLDDEEDEDTNAASTSRNILSQGTNKHFPQFWVRGTKGLISGIIGIQILVAIVTISHASLIVHDVLRNDLRSTELLDKEKFYEVPPYTTKSRLLSVLLVSIQFMKFEDPRILKNVILNSKKCNQNCLETLYRPDKEEILFPNKTS